MTAREPAPAAPARAEGASPAPAAGAARTCGLGCELPENHHGRHDDLAGNTWPRTFGEAFLELQSQIPRITKTAEAQVGTRKTSYADLPSIHEAVFPILHRHRFAWHTDPDLLRPEGQQPQFVLRWELEFIPTGQTRAGVYPLPSNTPQTMGGAITYARRYVLNAVLGIAPAEDDDDAAGAETEAAADKGTNWTPPADPKTRRMQRQRDTAGEETEYQTPGPDDEAAKAAPGSINVSQRRRLQILYRQTGRHSHDDHMAAISKYLPGVTVTGTDQLSFREAETLARRLAAEKTSPGGT